MRNWRLIIMTAVLLGAANWSQPAVACPMCKVALEDDEDASKAARPKAYMYSILFMLSMPATLITVFGVTFYRLSKKQQAINQALFQQMHEGLGPQDPEPPVRS